jgi:hypothetical protein
MYDATKRSKLRLTIADVVRSSAHAERWETAGSGVLYFRLTKHGVLVFQHLTQELARRGKALNRRLHVTLEINHHVYARPMVDYQVFPQGLDASQGLQIGGLTLSMARRLAEEIRAGP